MVRRDWPTRKIPFSFFEGVAMAKQKSPRRTDLPFGKRVSTRLANEITRLENTAKMIENWPDDEHDIATLKLNLGNSLGWLRNARAIAEKIPEDFKPSFRKPPRSIKQSDVVVITKRYLSDYGYKEAPVCEVLEVVGRRLRIEDVESGMVMLVARGHVTYKEVEDE